MEIYKQEIQDLYFSNLIYNRFGIIEPALTEGQTLDQWLNQSLEGCIVQGQRACKPIRGDTVDLELV